MRADDQRVGLAAEAFSFGYPMVCMVRQMVRAAEEGIGPIPPAGFNAFAHETDPPGPLSSFLHINPDVLFSIAQVDLGPGPVVLHVPPTVDRYHMLALYDPWLNVFAYLGTRAGGEEGGEVLLVPPGEATSPAVAEWAALDRRSTQITPERTDGQPVASAVGRGPGRGRDAGRGPGSGRGGGLAGTIVAEPVTTDGHSGGRPVIECPARALSIVARFACHGPRDVPAVRALQDQLTLRPLDPAARRAEGPPERSKQVCDDLRFWEEFRIWMRAFPAPPVEHDYARRFEPLGLLADPSPYIDPDPALAWSLRAGLRAGRDELERLADAGRRAHQGWVGTLHEADYNLDRFGPGVLDSPAWEIPDRAQARIARAMAARRPLGIVHAYETTSASCAVDLDGHRLTGAHDYRLRLRPPPVNSFWTLTMYDEPDGYLVDNPIDRYSISSLDDLVHEPDGAVPVLIQSDEPERTPSAPSVNWLPAAKGDFRLVLRMYCPGQEVLTGAYAPPAIHRLA